MAAKIKQIKRLSTIVTNGNSNRRFHIRRYCVVIRRSTHPYATYTCRKCEQNDQFINSLSDRINNIEKLIKHLSTTIKASNMCVNNDVPSANSKPFNFDIDNFSKMETDQLIKFSTQLGIRLFGKQDDKQETKEENINNNEIYNMNGSVRNIVLQVLEFYFRFDLSCLESFATIEPYSSFHVVHSQLVDNVTPPSVNLENLCMRKMATANENKVLTQ
ncbi:6379_t:CDS:2 [Cetraspora pellucida]|uniref:6379_t:CDS:1 n=1 Tax=Cetraspora pellucida TaxID=1433469 RepID=A0A9N9HI68_9GLOM|nr:6379_t:CDS:2 [Cetraspora pellucida]